FNDVEIRSPAKEKLERMRAKIEAKATEITDALGVGCSIEAIGHFEPITFDPKLVTSVRDAAERLGDSHRNITSCAGHDACWA
ncbi:Zn-dependent hydrolase, partial [Rhizobium ruizarguesonis]